jgi:hypothetical protein
MRRTAAAVAAAWALGGALAGPARADDDASGARVARLEDALRRQAEETARLRREFDEYRRRNPSGGGLTADEAAFAVDRYLASAPPAVAVAASARGGWRWGGYFHTEFLAPSNSTKNWIDVHRFILSVNADVTDHVEFRSEIEIEHGGVNNGASPLDGDILVEFAEVVFRAHDAFTPKVGAILIPFGGYNHRHDDPENDFTLRPYTARFFVPTGFGQPGIGVEGAMPFGCGHVFSYDVALTNGFDDEFSAANGVRSARRSWRNDNNDAKQVWARVQADLEVPGLDALEIGASGTWGRYDDAGDDDLFGWGLDLFARLGPLEVKGEYVAYDLERGADDPPDAVSGLHGFWLEAAWHFFPGFWRGCRGAFATDTSLFTLAARWQHQDTDEDATGAHLNDDLTQWSLGLNYRVTESLVFRVDHTWFDAEEADDFEQWAVSFSTYL